MPRMQNRFADVGSASQGWGAKGLAARVRGAAEKRRKQTGSKGFAADQAAALKAWEQDRVGTYAREQERQSRMRGGSARVRF